MTRILDSFTRSEKAVLLGCVLALMYFAGGFWGRAKSFEALPPVFAAAPQSKSSAAKLSAVKSPSGSAPVTIHVAGAVRKPGVLRMPAGSRVDDALKMAGGAAGSADLSSLNLAQKLKDGEQILVREKGERLLVEGTPALPQSRSASSAKLPLRPVNVNTAGAGELQTLPGIGPATAARIMETRAKGRFRLLSDLDEVKGLGPKKLEKLKPYVTF